MKVPKGEKTTIEILHPIRHDGIDYSRGLIDLEGDLADTFLGLKDAVTRKAIARIPEKKEPVKATATPVKDTKEPQSPKDGGKK